MYATLLLTGLRKEELAHLTWDDVDFHLGVIRVRGKADFIPKDYEERDTPMPPDLIPLLKNLPRSAEWVFPLLNGNRFRVMNAPSTEANRNTRQGERDSA